MLAPVCSSFCAANQGTAARDLLNGWGNFFHPSISRGNKLMSRTKSCSSSLFKTVCLSNIFGSLIKSCFCVCVRTILLAVLITVVDCLFLLEQPGGSSVLAYPRAKWFIRAMKRIGIPVSWLSNSIFLLRTLADLNNSCSTFPSHRNPKLFDQGIPPMLLDAASWWKHPQTNHVAELFQKGWSNGPWQVEQQRS